MSTKLYAMQLLKQHVTELNIGKKWNQVACYIQVARLDNPVGLPCCKLWGYEETLHLKPFTLKPIST